MFDKFQFIPLIHPTFLWIFIHPLCLTNSTLSPHSSYLSLHLHSSFILYVWQIPACLPIHPTFLCFFIHPLFLTNSSLSPSFILPFFVSLFILYASNIPILVVPSFILPFLSFILYASNIPACLGTSRNIWNKKDEWKERKDERGTTFLSFYSSFMFQIFLLVPFYPYFLVIFFLIISNIFKIKKTNILVFFCNFINCLKCQIKSSLYHKLKLSNPYIFATSWCKPLIF